MREVVPKYVAIPDWVKMSGMGRTKTFHHIGTKDLRAVKLGSRTLIDVDHGLKWMASLPEAEIRMGKKTEA